MEAQEVCGEVCRQTATGTADDRRARTEPEVEEELSARLSCVELRACVVSCGWRGACNSALTGGEGRTQGKKQMRLRTYYMLIEKYFCLLYYSQNLLKARPMETYSNLFENCLAHSRAVSFKCAYSVCLEDVQTTGFRLFFPWVVPRKPGYESKESEGKAKTNP